MVKKHVLMVINSLSQGGAERVASILLEQYSRDENFSMELVLLENEIAYDIPEGVKVTVLSKLGNQDSTLKKTLSIPLLAYRLVQYIKKSDIDVVMSFIYRADFVNVLASYYHDKPIIVSERVNASSTYNNNSLNAKINTFLIRRLYPKADIIINVSHGTKQDLVDNFSIEESKQCVIYNPYDIGKIQTMSGEGLDFELEKAKTMIAVSRFRPIKNIEMMIRAFAALSSDDAKLIIVGDGHEEKKLIDLSESLGVSARVRFVGAQDNPYKYMSKASIYLSSSRSEGFPNALVEAMICGCAIISTDCPSGPREILAPHSDLSFQLQEGMECAQYGMLVAVDDTKALTEAMDQLLKDQTLREGYVKKAQNRIYDFQLKTIHQQYSRIFSTLFKGEEG